jgi:Kef-type K+ transport system membrane component KefB
MELTEETLLILTVVLFFGLIIPEFFKVLQLPFASSLIIVGSILAPYGFNYMVIDQYLELFGFLGAAFLMLMAGLEVRAAFFKNIKDEVRMLVVFNNLVPFMVGVILAKIFSYSWPASLALGILFMSSSAPVIFSTINFLKLQTFRIGKILKSTTSIDDILSLAALTLLFQYLNPSARFPLPIYLGLVISSVVILKMFLPEIVLYFFGRFKSLSDEYEGRLRVVITFLLVVLLIYSSLNIHAIIAAFLVGFTLAEVKGIRSVQKKLHILGHGLFVPIFFFVLGVQTDFTLLLTLNNEDWLVLLIIVSMISSKFLSALVTCRFASLSLSESLFIGIGTTTKLTTAISLSYAALLLEIIDVLILTGVVTASLLSTIINPPLMTFLAKKIELKND